MPAYRQPLILTATLHLDFKKQLLIALTKLLVTSIMNVKVGLLKIVVSYSLAFLKRDDYGDHFGRVISASF